MNGQHASHGARHNPRPAPVPLSSTAPNPPEPDPALLSAIEHVLAHKAALPITPDFAARVAGQATALVPARASRWLGWGHSIAVTSALALVAGLFALAPHTTPSLTDLRFDGELLLLAELSALLLFSGRLFSRG